MVALTRSGRVPSLPTDAYLEESPAEYVVHFAVPGFAPEKLEVEVADQIVTLRGDRQQSELGAFRLHDRLEERFELPCDADPRGVTASYRNEAIEFHVLRFPGGCPPARRIAISRPLAMNADASVPPGYELDREIFARNAPPPRPRERKRDVEAESVATASGCRSSRTGSA